MQPPQNPYPQPPYGQPSPVYRSASGPLPREPRGIVSMDVISEAWGYLIPNIGAWLLAVIAFLGISYGLSFLCFSLQDQGQKQSVPLWIFVAQLVCWAVTQLLLGGLAKLAISTIRTGSAKFSEMWNLKSAALPLLLSSILQGFLYLLVCIPGLILFFISILLPLLSLGKASLNFLGTGKIGSINTAAAGASVGGILLGFLLFFLSILLLASLLFLATSLIVDGQAGAWGAIAKSFGTLRKHFWSALLLMILLSLINFAGTLACCIGILFTIPLTHIAIALVYRDLFGSSDGTIKTPFFVPPPPAPPLADPNF